MKKPKTRQFDLLWIFALTSLMLISVYAISANAMYPGADPRFSSPYNGWFMPPHQLANPISNRTGWYNIRRATHPVMNAPAFYTARFGHRPYQNRYPMASGWVQRLPGPQFRPTYRSPNRPRTVAQFTAWTNYPAARPMSVAPAYYYPQQRAAWQPSQYINHLAANPYLRPFPANYAYNRRIQSAQIPRVAQSNTNPKVVLKPYASKFAGRLQPIRIASNGYILRPTVSRAGVHP